MHILFGFALLLFALLPGHTRAEPVKESAQLERSYWLHASLGLFTQRGYFGPDYPATEAPTRDEIRRAATLLTGTYAANRLYLIYHRELPLEEARRIFIWWREACPAEVELVPALVLRMYDRKQTPLYSTAELGELADFLRERINPRNVAVYDIYSGRDQGEALTALAGRFSGGLVRLGVQPGEEVRPPYTGGVQDTWSGFCHGTRNEEDWLTPGFGAETLRGWVQQRNGAIHRMVWNLITVAWDYSATARGGYPGYDDAEKNMPLPVGRNLLAARLIADTADPERFGGFSSDLYILHENSRSAAHDGKGNAFYQTLRAGKAYEGYYGTPFREIIQIYEMLKAGRWPVNGHNAGSE